MGELAGGLSGVLTPRLRAWQERREPGTRAGVCMRACMHAHGGGCCVTMSPLFCRCRGKLERRCIRRHVGVPGQWTGDTSRDCALHPVEAEILTSPCGFQSGTLLQGT